MRKSQHRSDILLFPEVWFSTACFSCWNEIHLINFYIIYSDSCGNSGCFFFFCTTFFQSQLYMYDSCLPNICPIWNLYLAWNIFFLSFGWPSTPVKDILVKKCPLAPVVTNTVPWFPRVMLSYCSSHPVHPVE